MSKGVIVYGHIGNSLRMEALHTAILHGCDLTIVPPHIMPTDSPKEALLFHATPPTEIEIPKELTKTRRERTHPNEPFYRKFQKGRKW